MSDAEIGAMVRGALESEGVLATLTLRRGHDDGTGEYSAALHVYQDHADPKRPEMGLVKNGHHKIGKGRTLGDALRRARDP